MSEILLRIGTFGFFLKREFERESGDTGDILRYMYVFRSFGLAAVRIVFSVKNNGEIKSVSTQ